MPVQTPEFVVHPGKRLFGSSLLDGLVAYFPMNEGGGGFIHDVLEGQLGTLHGSFSWVPSPFGSSIGLDGSTAYIDFPHTAKLSFGPTTTSPFTIVIWIYWISSTEAYNNIWDTSAGGTVGNAFLLKSSGSLAQYFNVGNQDPISADTIPNNQWTMVTEACNFNGNLIEIYINNKRIKSTTVSGDSISDTGSMQIGGHAPFGSGRWFNGRVAHFGWWNRLLNPSEVQALYANPGLLFATPLRVAGVPPAIVEIDKSVSDSITLSDSITELIQVPQIAFSENLTFSDAVGIVGNDLMTFSESMTLSDSMQFTAGVAFSFGDSLSLSDSVSELLITVLTVAIGDSLSLSDSEQVGATIPRKIIGDFILFTDTIATRANLQLSVSDQLVLNDLVGILLAPIANLTPSDQLTLADSISVNLQSIFTNIGITVSDTIAFQDAVQVALSKSLISITDSFSLNDEVKVVLQSTLNSYIRRYLNDVI